MAPHLDDEQLSALADGEAVPGAADHLRTCGSCTARLASFRSAVALAGTPVPPLTAERVEEMVGRALAGEVLRPTTRRSASGPPTLLVALAAGLVLLLGLAALVADLGGGRDDVVATGRTTADEAHDAATSSGGGATASAEASTANASTEANEQATMASPASGAARAHLGAHDDERSLVRALVARLSHGGGGDGGDQSVDQKSRAMCEDEARAVAGDRVSSLTYDDALSWRGQDARVLVFVLTEPIDGDTRQAYVMSVPSCAVLSEPRF